MNTHALGYWLNKKRLTIYPKIIVAVLLAVLMGIYVFLKLSGDNFYYANDFSIFWTVSRLSLEGNTAKAYDYLYLLDKVREIAPVINSRWFYFPTYDLLIMPLGLLPYGMSYLVFMTTTMAAYFAVVWRILPYKEALWWLAAFGGVWINLRFGQNGFLTAALVGVALFNIHKRPYLAGICIGLLTIKPHLAILFPVALIASKAWRTLLIASLSCLLLMFISTEIIGVESLIAAINSIAQARELIENSESVGFWQIMPTFFAGSMLLGLPISVSYAIHYIIATLAIISTWVVWRSSPSDSLRCATFIVATLLISPYLHIYDLTWLALAIAWMIKTGMQEGWGKGEREVLIAAWLLPFLDVSISRSTDLQIAPIVVLAMLFILLKRYRNTALQLI